LLTPKAFLSLEFDGQVLHRTNIYDVPLSAASPDWIAELPLTLRVPQDLLSVKVLHVFLYYAGAIYGEDKVGVTNISLSNLDFEPLESASYSINCMLTDKGQRAVKLAEKENRVLPSLHVSMSVVDSTD